MRRRVLPALEDQQVLAVPLDLESPGGKSKREDRFNKCEHSSSVITGKLTYNVARRSRSSQSSRGTRVTLEKVTTQPLH